MTSRHYHYDKEYSHQYYLDHRQYYLDDAKERYESRRSGDTKNRVESLKKWREDNPGKTLWQRCTQKRKSDVFSHYCLEGIIKCAHCGITDIDVLCLDHVNDNGANERKLAGLGSCFYQWIKRNNYPVGYQVLCANCNLKKQIKKNG